MEIGVGRCLQESLSANATDYSIIRLGDGLHTVNVSAANGEVNLSAGLLYRRITSTTNESNGIIGAQSSLMGSHRALTADASVAEVAAIIDGVSDIQNKKNERVACLRVRSTENITIRLCTDKQGIPPPQPSR